MYHNHNSRTHKISSTTTMRYIMLRGILPWSQDQINYVWTHTHKKILLKIFNHLFLSISSLSLKKYFFMCV